MPLIQNIFWKNGFWVRSWYVSISQPPFSIFFQWMFRWNFGTKCDAVYVCICQQVDCRRTTFYGEHHAIACRVCEKNGLFQLVSCISRWFGNISSWGVLAKSRYCPRTGGPCGTVAAELDAQLKKFAISHIENKHWSICNLRFTRFPA